MTSKEFEKALQQVTDEETFNALLDAILHDEGTSIEFIYPLARFIREAKRVDAPHYQYQGKTKAA